MMLVKKGAHMKYSSNNRDWGFFGTVQANFGVTESQAEMLFDYACKQLNKLDKNEYLVKTYYDNQSHTPVSFLDSRAGRHLCDSMTMYADMRENITLREIKVAICEAIEKW
jgi:hypothetical protein